VTVEDKTAWTVWPRPAGAHRLRLRTDLIDQGKGNGQRTESALT
jgi:hypothetical protein